MNKLLKFIAALFFILVLAVLLLPVVFKGKLKQVALEQANKQLNAIVTFDDVSLSLIKSFPDFSFSIEGVSIDGVNEFDGIRLIEMGELSLTLDLMSVINGEQIEMKMIKVDNLDANILVTDSGLANYDIVKTIEETESAESPEDGESAFKLNLQGYEFSNINLNYTDRQSDIILKIHKLNHTGKGDFTQDIVNLSTETRADAISFAYEGLDFLNKASVSSEFDLIYHQQDGKLEFGENNVLLNALGLNFSGWVWPKDESIELDMKFDAPNTDFKSVLSLIPAVFMQDFESVQTTGKFHFTGSVSGEYQEVNDELPAFDLALNVSNASFKYPSLPAGVDNISVDLLLSKKQGNTDKLVINLKEAKAVIAENPFFARILIETPISDPKFDLALQGRIDLASLASVVPMDGANYRGLIEANFKAAAKQSDIDSEQYDRVGAKGELIASNMHFESDSLPFIVDMRKAELMFTPQKVELKELSMTIGSSDMSFKGELDNLLSYALNDQTLVGRFEFKSELLDLNELAGTSEETPTSESVEDTSALEIIRIPQNLDLILNSDVEKILFSNLEMGQLQGELVVKDGAIRLNKVGMNMLDGSLQADGSYDSKPDLPIVDMDFSLADVGFKESYDAFQMVQQLAPIMEKTTGKYSTSFSFQSELGSDMMPDLESVYSKGRLKSKGLSSEPDVMKKVADLLKDPKLAKLDVGSVDIEFEVKDGRMSVEPFDIQTAGVKAQVSGSTGLDQSIDYTMDMNVPTDRISSSGLLNSTGITLPKKVDVKVLIGGKTTDPTVKTSLGDLSTSIVNDVKEQVNQIVEEKIEEVKDDTNEAAQKLIDDANRKGDQLIAEAEKQGDALRAEAKKQGDALRSEANKQADKIEKDAKGNFLKEAAAKEAAKKIRKEADKKADALEQEADKQANALIAQAKKEKEDLVATAREEAKID